MVEAQGQVVKLDDDFVWVETEIKSGCNHCSSRSGCGTGILSSVLGKRRPQVRVENSLDVKPGDAVVVAVEENGIVTGSLLLYLLPLLLMIILAVVGDSFFGESGAILLALVGLVSGFWIARTLTRGAIVSKQLRPVLVRRVEPVIGFH
ncbi:MAG: SoxR reducing system RseC family protein [Gammaproteobacteria bacterium]|nr:SoxR reducing system RseC family protein [Gammaproteobacteria bacterium]